MAAAISACKEDAIATAAQILRVYSRNCDVLCRTGVAAFKVVSGVSGPGRTQISSQENNLNRPFRPFILHKSTKMANFFPKETTKAAMPASRPLPCQPDYPIRLAVAVSLHGNWEALAVQFQLVRWERKSLHWRSLLPQ